MESATNYRSKSIDHLGLVAGIARELQIVETIDNLIPSSSPDKKVSVGQAVLAMILNGLGFVNQRLYLTPQFFEDKPVDKLISPDIKADYLNDDCLGRCLDTIYKHGCTDLYSLIVTRALEHFKIDCKIGSIDMTNFSLYGSYENQNPEAVKITDGYSKAHRPDLNQVSLLLITTYQSRIPILMEPLDGNQEEGKAYNNLVKNHIDQLQVQTGLSFVTFDSKGYSAKNLAELLGHPSLKWLCRVPSSLKDVKELYQQADLECFTKIDEKYSYLPLCSNYGGVNQRWLLVYSKELAKTNKKTIEKQITKEVAVQEKALKKLMSQSFSCNQDAKQALATFEKQLRYCQLKEVKINGKRKYLKRGKPNKQTPFKMEYSIETSLEINEENKQKRLKKAGLFVLATNELDSQALPDQDFLKIYRGQDGCEKGFRFLKDPNVVGSSLFLEKNERIEALLMVMTLCLFVYACLEHKIRTALAKEEDFFPDQKGKATKNPTARWVFHCFKGIHLLVIDETQKLILNINETHRKLLDILGRKYWIYYS